ncbi:MAG: hypothetical protein WB588_02575 [Dehalococcoidia bacterium]
MKKAIIFGLLGAAAVVLSACSISLPGTTAEQPLPARPDVLIFTAQPSNIENGNSVKLEWEVKGADNITIDNGIGPVALQGSMEVKPETITAYNLHASNAGGTIGYTVIVNVRPAVKTTSPSSAVNTITGVSPTNNKPDFPLSLLPPLGKNEEYVFFKGAVMVGADNHYIVLRNNPSAHNPTWAELKSFLQTDQTDKHLYIPGKFTCGDFAEMLHNNAEAAGIRAAIVAIELQPDSGDGSLANHSFNAFETTDRGTVYIDDVSSSQGFFADKIVNFKVGQEYSVSPIFPQTGQQVIWPDMGIVVSIDVFQW